jgi:hypothetical protein
MTSGGEGGCLTISFFVSSFFSGAFFFFFLPAGFTFIISGFRQFNYPSINTSDAII